MNNSNSPLIDIYSDHSIENAIHFNFNEYADCLARIIINQKNKAPFTILINGKWGTGKTTLMKTLKSKLESNDGENHVDGCRIVKSVWFDAWKYHDQDSLLSALAIEIYDNIEKDKSLLKLSWYEKIFYSLKFKIRKVDRRQFIIDYLNYSLNSRFSGDFDVSKWIKSPKSDNKLSYYSRFNHYLDSLIDVYFENEDNNRCLVIFIDDLDRCSPKSVTEVLETINLFFDKGNCIFVIGMDNNKIANIVEKHYSNYTIATNGNKKEILEDSDYFSGKEYVKKFFQIQFNLPSLHEKDLNEYFNLMHYNESISEYDYSSIVDFLKENNLRDIKRFFNTVFLVIGIKNHIVIQNSLRVNISNELLIKWQLLQYLYPDIISEINNDLSGFLKFSNYITSEHDLNAKIPQEINTFYKYFSDNKLISILKYNNQFFDKCSIEACQYYFSFTEHIINSKGNLTISADGCGSYYFGESIRFSGTCNVSNKVFLFISSKKNLRKNMRLDDPSIECRNDDERTFTIAHISAEHTWEYSIDTKQIYSDLPKGEFTVHAVSHPYTNPESDNQKYSSISISLKEPFVTATVNKSNFVIGDELLILGTATGEPQHIYVWICGDNTVYQYKENVFKDGSFEFSFKKNNIESGQYYVIIQHPLFNKNPNVYMKENKLFFKGKEIETMDNLKGKESAELILNLFQSPDCKEKYFKLTFMAKEPIIIIKDIGTIKKGEIAEISGITNLSTKSILEMQIIECSNNNILILSENLKFEDKSMLNSRNWSFYLNTQNLRPGSYVLRIINFGRDQIVEKDFKIQ